MSSALTPLHAGSAALLVIDIQDKLLPTINGVEGMTAAACRMIRAARVLGLPMLLSEQYPAGLGRTVPAVRQAMGDVPAVEKVCFSACVDAIKGQLAAMGRPDIVVVGIETHVCVQQTVLDLLRGGYVPFVCADAVSSRRAVDREMALQRMRHAGAIVTTTESAIFEMLGQAGTEQFKQILKLVK